MIQQNRILHSFLSLSLLLSPLPSSAQITYKKFSERPKLVVVLVIDQFRSDYLTRFPNEFLPVKSGGFRMLMEQGAYFPYAQYDVLQCITCPGHAAILSGSRPYLNGVIANNWFDIKSNTQVYCVDDKEFGLSPRRMKSSTVGDEIKNSDLPSKVVAIALKDRASIMLGGHRADTALWMGNNLLWTTSKYYNQGQLPQWASKENESLAKTTRKPEMQGQIWGVQKTIDVALSALKSEKLGKNKGTDILAIGLSTHDIAGHKLGPNAPEMKVLTLGEDKEIARLVSEIKSHMGSLDSVVISLTADHGVAPSVEYSAAAKIESGRINSIDQIKSLYAALNDKFGSPKSPWLSATLLFHMYINPEALKETKAKAEDVENLIRSTLLAQKEVLAVFTKTDFLQSRFPAGELGEQVKRSYVLGQSGDVVVIPRPFHLPADGLTTTHMTGFSYDRSVPLVIYSPSRVKAGVYSNGKVIDLAPTLSFILSVLPPSMNE
ncbi:MAG: alkaline phosphatase family protein, partial [Pseudobdellovibrionaceae bacterium]